MTNFEIKVLCFAFQLYAVYIYTSYLIAKPDVSENSATASGSMGLPNTISTTYSNYCYYHYYFFFVLFLFVCVCVCVCACVCVCVTIVVVVAVVLER